MSILIKGVKMPEKCAKCFAYDMDYQWCKALWANTNWDTRDSSCPLVEVPAHGRLIDADSLLERQRKFYCEDCERRKGRKNGKIQFLYEIGGVPCRACHLNDAMCGIEDAPTVIEAEDGE